MLTENWVSENDYLHAWGVATFRGSFYIPDFQISSQIQESLTPKSRVLMRKFTHESDEPVLNSEGRLNGC